MPLCKWSGKRALQSHCRQHFLNFLPLPHGQGSLGPTGSALVATGFAQASDVEPAIGALMTIGSVVWPVADKRRR
jgi:hypothetical protein